MNIKPVFRHSASQREHLNIFVSCGEPSGDLYAADFVKELLAAAPQTQKAAAPCDANIWGMYGPVTQNILNKSPVWDYEQLKLMGFLEVIPAIPRILKLKNEIVNSIINEQPDAVILVDCPDFHLMLAKSLRKRNYQGKIISLIPPTVWAWREGRIKNLKRDFDLCLPLFKFEHEFLISRGVKSLWSAHPLFWDLKDFKAPESLYKKFDTSRLVAIMPGSRRYDIKYHLDILIETAKILKRDGYLPVFSIASGLSPDLAVELREKLKLNNCEFIEGGRELMAASQAVIAVSGTVAVEAMLLRRFTVVIYNMNKFSYFILKRLVHVKNISTPNYMADKMIFPELLCENANPERIINELYNYLNNQDVKADIDAGIERARLNMGDKNAAEFWVQCVLKILNGSNENEI